MQKPNPPRCVLWHLDSIRGNIWVQSWGQISIIPDKRKSRFFFGARPDAKSAPQLRRLISALWLCRVAFRWFWARGGKMKSSEKMCWRQAADVRESRSNRSARRRQKHPLQMYWRSSLVMTAAQILGEARAPASWIFISSTCGQQNVRVTKVHALCISSWRRHLQGWILKHRSRFLLRAFLK